MSLLLGLQFREQLRPVLADELDQLVASLQSLFAARLTGDATGVTLGLQYRDQLSTVEANELDQLIAAIQTALSATTVVRSVQRGTVTIPSGSLTATGTLGTSVDLSVSRLRLLGVTSDDTGNTNSVNCARIALTDASTITATRREGTSTNLVVSYEVTQYFADAISSIQRFTFNLAGATTGTATLTAVDTTKAELDFLGAEAGDTGAGGQNNFTYADVVLTNATTVTINRGGSSANPMVVGGQVVEFR